MAFSLRNIFQQPKERIEYKPSLVFSSSALPLTEKFKGKVKRNEILFPKNIGEQHPFDFATVEGIYISFGLVTGIVDKYVDFIVGPGVRIITQNIKAKQILEKFMDDVDFLTLLRAWVKEGLCKGTGFVELAIRKNEPTGMKILDAKWMYIKRNELGEIETINQIKIDSRSKNIGYVMNGDMIEFKMDEIAILPLNVLGDNVYGMGIVAPALKTLDQLLALQKDMLMIVHRKANAPIHAKIGNDKFMPAAGDVEAFGTKLEHLQNKNEWATDWLVDMKVLDFGDISGKFEVPLKHIEDILFFTFQVPEVIMGRGNIAEGLAKVQMDAFERRIQSLQAEVSKAVEQQIFKRILKLNGIEEQVDLEWGQQSQTERNEQIRIITELLKNPLLNFSVRTALEKELTEVMGLQIVKTPEEEKAAEQKQTVPFLPAQNLAIQQSYNNFVIGEMIE